MNAYRIIDKATWPRAEMFDFYSAFANPCFNISVALEAQALYDHAKHSQKSFFLLCLYAILRAANSVPQVRQRILENGQIVEFEKIAVMTPIMTQHEMFRQVWCEYAPTFDEFAEEATRIVEAAKLDSPSGMTQRGEDFICASCQPWLHFTAIMQSEYSFGQAVPILSWGKMKNGLVPISCKFNHAFLDGLHVARFFGSIEQSFAQPDTLWTRDAAAPVK